MNDNSTLTERLIQYLDGELQGDSLVAVEEILTENPSAREELENLELSKESVKSYGLKESIGSIHAEMMKEFKEKDLPEQGIVKTIYFYSLRAVAVLIFLFGVSALYQYYTATPEKLFNENFHAFQIHESRGNSKTQLEDLYESGDMSGLIRQYNQIKSPEAKDYFLAGNAFLSTHQPAQAIEAFKKLDQFNKSNHTRFFEEDAEYFLALSYLGNHEPARALPIFEKIHADPNHAFHEAVSSWFLLRIKRLAR